MTKLINMKRRDAIKNILLASASTLFITGCSEANVVELIRNNKILLDNSHKDYLFKISESFLPIADLKEKVGNPVDFIMTMINDCHSPKEVASFANGFEQYKMLMEQSKLKIKSAKEDQVIPVVQKILEETEQIQEDIVFFINKTKNLSVKHLVSSEYYMSEYLDYSLIPKEPFDGCAETQK